jgi:uncharacterized protein
VSVESLRRHLRAPPDPAFASELIRVEALRTIDRARVRFAIPDEQVSRKRAEVLELLDGFHMIALDRAVLERAGEAFPTLISTLDALHLASAVLLRAEHEELVLATHDTQLATAARAVGLRVLGARPG